MWVGGVYYAGLEPAPGDVVLLTAVLRYYEFPVHGDGPLGPVVGAISRAPASPESALTLERSLVLRLP